MVSPLGIFGSGSTDQPGDTIVGLITGNRTIEKGPPENANGDPPTFTLRLPPPIPSKYPTLGAFPMEVSLKKLLIKSQPFLFTSVHSSPPQTLF